MCSRKDKILKESNKKFKVGVLSSLSWGKINFPTPKQAKVLCNIYQRAKEKDMI